MSWSEALRWLIPVAFVAMVELLRRGQGEPRLARARARARRSPR